ncbi:hypothetical protein [Paracoccus denitrificans]|uniref:hypothetical protein n=1 Tax=Paracoccus denitrificans TaxID=266 RepID=UPI003364C010
MADPDFTRALERLEAKVDRMSDAIVSLARMEERMVTLFNRMDRYDTEQREVIKRVAELERVAIGRGRRMSRPISSSPCCPRTQAEPSLPT